jgi:uncharacterized protein (TIGR02246 family)
MLRCSGIAALESSAVEHERSNRMIFMRKLVRISIMLSLVLSIGISVSAQNSLRDKAAIEAAIANWDKAWNTKDAKLASQDYSDDADWTNAFGMRRTGRVEIEKTLRQVFSLAFVTAGQSRTVEQNVKFRSKDLAVVWTRVERAGQQRPTGEELGTRQTSHLRIFQRKGKRWEIVEHLISDARSRETGDQ